MRLAAWNGLATTLKHLSSFLPAREDSEEEARLYYRRACLAATEERYDVALIFCAKAVDLNPNDLATRLLIAQIHDYGLHDVNGAVDAYRRSSPSPPTTTAIRTAPPPARPWTTWSGKPRS